MSPSGNQVVVKDSLIELGDGLVEKLIVSVFVYQDHNRQHVCHQRVVAWISPFSQLQVLIQTLGVTVYDIRDNTNMGASRK
jgi:23S rRNA maturation mini-RNase III